MYRRKKFSITMTQNSALSEKIRPEDLMSQLGIKKDTYYADLKYLGIKADKDEEGKVYLTFEQAEQVRALRSYVNRMGKRDGFEIGSIVQVTDSETELATAELEPDIYLEPEEPTAQFDVNGLMRSAAELKARELAMPHLVKREIANRMGEDDLPEDLREKVAIAALVAGATSPVR
jgi:hypothetical protein